jgi:hypothetical protein
MNSDSIIQTLNCLTRKGIRLICIDFDNTFISIPTYGKWSGNPIDLADYARPILIQFIKKCIQRNIYIAIVTFSPQENIVKECLKYIFKSDFDKIYIKTSNHNYKNCNPKYCKLLKKKIKMTRKNPMMISVATDIFIKNNDKILPPQILLIDDSWDNICAARKAGYKVYYFSNEKELSIINDLASSKIEHYSNPTTYTFIYADMCKLILVLAIVLFLFWKDRVTTEMTTRLVSVKL